MTKCFTSHLINCTLSPELHTNNLHNITQQAQHLIPLIPQPFKVQHLGNQEHLVSQKHLILKIHLIPTLYILHAYIIHVVYISFYADVPCIPVILTCFAYACHVWSTTLNNFIYNWSGSSCWLIYMHMQWDKFPCYHCTPITLLLDTWWHTPAPDFGAAWAEGVNFTQRKELR
jgi:hypothetical protein